MRILLVEDEEATAALLRGTLEAMGHEVVVEVDGLRAWNRIRDHHTPLVLSDWMMPHLDGPALCRRIRGLVDTSYTYIILLTAREGRADRMEGLRAGADDFLVKPVNAEELSVRLEIARRILSVQDRLERQNARLVELASTDELTGLANRREFRRSLESNFALANRQGLPLSLIIFDVDHFKSYNDEFGHPAGDVTLRAMGDTMRANCRDHEPAARYGGEEFALVLFGSDRETARGTAERLRSAIAGRAWPHRPVTASFGVATTGRGVRTVEELVEQADAALYFSKHQGRNRVTHYEEFAIVMAPGAEPLGLPAPNVEVGVPR